MMNHSLHSRPLQLSDLTAAPSRVCPVESALCTFVWHLAPTPDYPKWHLAAALGWSRCPGRPIPTSHLPRLLPFLSTFPPPPQPSPPHLSPPHCTGVCLAEPVGGNLYPQDTLTGRTLFYFPLTGTPAGAGEAAVGVPSSSPLASWPWRTRVGEPRPASGGGGGGGGGGSVTWAPDERFGGALVCDGGKGRNGAEGGGGGLGCEGSHR